MKHHENILDCIIDAVDHHRRVGGSLPFITRDYVCDYIRDCFNNIVTDADVDMHIALIEVFQRLMR